MKRYQLAALVKLAGTLHSRKRLQKVVYLLQAAGCDLNVEYSLHHYGPYSWDVASLTNEMVQAGLLIEEEQSPAGRSFSYRLSDKAQTQIEQLEQSPDHDRLMGQLADHQELARKLLEQNNLQQLEFAATIAYFRNKDRDRDWDRGRKRAAEFKGKDEDGVAMIEALKFAQEVLNEG